MIFKILRVHGHARGYPRIAGTGTILYPQRVAGEDADEDLGLRVWICEVSIRADFIRCHLDTAVRTIIRYVQVEGYPLLEKSDDYQGMLISLWVLRLSELGQS